MKSHTVYFYMFYYNINHISTSVFKHVNVYFRFIFHKTSLSVSVLSVAFVTCECINKALEGRGVT